MWRNESRRVDIRPADESKYAFYVFGFLTGSQSRAMWLNQQVQPTRKLPQGTRCSVTVEVLFQPEKYQKVAKLYLDS